jgi:hypothetical protein
VLPVPRGIRPRPVDRNSAVVFSKERAGVPRLQTRRNLIFVLFFFKHTSFIDREYDVATIPDVPAALQSAGAWLREEGSLGLTDMCHLRPCTIFMAQTASQRARLRRRLQDRAG